MGACDIIYNKEAGTIFTRTPESWGKIGLFYLVYYSGLAAFFGAMLSVFLFAFTDDTAPLLVGEKSILPPNPGMGFRPMPDETKTFIQYSKSKNATYLPYINDLNNFLNETKARQPVSYLMDQSSLRDCAVDPPAPAELTANSTACKFKVDEMEDVMANCVDVGYGFEAGTPCFAVKLNKIFEFVPELMNNTGPNLQLKCEGEYAADKDNVGTIEHYPKDGVPLYYWPYLGQKGYLNPLVFVKLTDPKMDILIQIVCKPINAKNIKQNKMSDGDGRVTIEVLISE